jgi:hypothetical protein
MTLKHISILHLLFISLDQEEQQTRLSGLFEVLTAVKASIAVFWVVKP